MYVQTSYRRNSYCNNEYAKRNVKPKTNSKSCNWENYEPKQILKLPIQKKTPKQQLVVTANFRKIHGHYLVKKKHRPNAEDTAFLPDTQEHEEDNNEEKNSNNSFLHRGHKQMDLRN